MNMRRTLKTPTLRMNEGGDVAGRGTGDKIPALYEPGEFVVSNDMLKAEPGLRGHLKNLRGEVLASQGKTVAQADAQALDYDDGPQGEAHGQARNRKTESDELEPLGVQGHRAARGGVQRGEAGGSGRVNPSLRMRDGGTFDPATNTWTPDPVAPSAGRAVISRPNHILGDNSVPAASSGTNLRPRDTNWTYGARPAPTPGTSLVPTGTPGSNGTRPNWVAGDNAAPMAGPNNPAFHGDGRYGATPGGAPSSFEATSTNRATGVGQPASIEPSTGGVLRDKVFGSSADWAKTGEALTKERSIPGSGSLGKLLTKVAPPLAMAGGGYEAYQGAKEGDLSKVAWGVGDAAAGAALLTPAAPAAGAYLTARGAYEAPKMLRDAIGPRGLETIGGTINQIGLKTGLWGSDDSAYLSSKGAMPPPTTAGAVTAPAPTVAPAVTSAPAATPSAPALRTANVSATKQANGNTLFSGTDVSGPVTYDGDAAKSLRSPGSTFNIMPGMSRAQIDQTLTRPDGGRWTPQDEAIARANLRDGVDVNRGIVAEKKPEFINAYKARTERRGQDLTTETLRRGQDITSSDSRYGHELSREVSRNRLNYDMNKDQRDYQAGRADKGFEQQQSADKAWTEHTATTFRTKDDKGNDVPDTQKAAAYTTAIDNTIGQLIPQFAKSPDPKMRAYAEDLTKRGRAALDKEDLANLQVMFERQQVHAKTSGGLNPFKSGGAVSQNLLDYKITGKDNSWFQNRSKTAGGQTIPDVNLRHGADANYVMPNFGAGSTYLTPNKLRGE